MCIGRIAAIVYKDIIEALRNKTILIAIFLPVAAPCSRCPRQSPTTPGFPVGVAGSERTRLAQFLETAAPILSSQPNMRN